ncbi:MAG: hypothetical protein AABX66_02890 [Nanoarchaeota archaeon]
MITGADKELDDLREYENSSFPCVIGYNDFRMMKRLLPQTPSIAEVLYAVREVSRPDPRHVPGLGKTTSHPVECDFFPE